jgi:hypothetical protein
MADINPDLASATTSDNAPRNSRTGDSDMLRDLLPQCRRMN